MAANTEWVFIESRTRREASLLRSEARASVVEGKDTSVRTARPSTVEVLHRGSVEMGWRRQ